MDAFVIQGNYRLCAANGTGSNPGSPTVCTCATGSSQNDNSQGRQHSSYTLAHCGRIRLACPVHVLEVPNLGVAEDDLSGG